MKKFEDTIIDYSFRVTAYTLVQPTHRRPSTEQQHSAAAKVVNMTSIWVKIATTMSCLEAPMLVYLLPVNKCARSRGMLVVLGRQCHMVEVDAIAPMPAFSHACFIKTNEISQRSADII